jgi:hypothetical protein
MVLPARDIALNLRFFGLFKERDLVWWFRSSLHFLRESFKRTSEPKPH